jgi:hypothetical protein
MGSNEFYMFAALFQKIRMTTINEPLLTDGSLTSIQCYKISEFFPLRFKATTA